MKQAEILRLLPGILQRTAWPGSPLSALLAAMEALQAPDEAVLADLGRYFDPYRAPDAFVVFLAGWVDLDEILAPSAERGAQIGMSEPLSTGVGRLRELIAAASYLSQWRGTARGLLRFLETATGVRGFAIDEAVAGPEGRPIPFHIRVRAPQETQPYQALLQQIIEREKPAYVTCELTFEP